MAQRDTAVSELHHRMNSSRDLAIRRIDRLENPRKRFEDAREILFDALNRDRN